MGFFAKLFGLHKEEQMPRPPEVCPVVMDQIEEKEKAEQNDAIEVVGEDRKY